MEPDGIEKVRRLSCSMAIEGLQRERLTLNFDGAGQFMLRCLSEAKAQLPVAVLESRMDNAFFSQAGQVGRSS